MRLQSLYIEEYKNIQKQTFDFSNNGGYVALIGLNGSGKSNLLEAVALVFNGILNKKKIPFNYELQYEHDGKTYLRSPRLAMIDGIKVNNAEMIYPSSIIACYSGEDLRLWHMAFEDYYMHYFKKAINNNLFSPQLIYINKYCWNIALLSLLCSKKDNVERFLKETFNIDNLDNVKVKFSFGNSDSFKNHIALSWIKRIQEGCLDKYGQASMKSILSYEVPLISKQSKEKTLFDLLYLLSQPKKNSAKGNNVEKYITEIKIENNGISFDEYSEGHKKLILIECITQVIGDDSSFLLLDEPDAHVHIENKKKILNTISQFNGQTILTTHSPIFTNLMGNDNIFPIEEGRLMSKEKQDLIASISSNELDIINGACVVNSKYIIITEGSTDINYIQQAVKALRGSNPRLKQFDKVAFLPQGSADHTESFYNDVVSKLPNSVKSILYLFDNDKAGQTNAEKIKTKPKVQYLFYQPNYEKPYTSNYYIEDYFPEKLYGKQLDTTNIPIPLSPNLHYHQIKEVVAAIQDQKNLAATIKKNIENKTKRYDASNYLNFQPLLLEILEKFSLL